MPKSLIRSGLLGLACLTALASCSKGAEQSSDSGSRESVGKSQSPDIAPSTAPGVAFTYDYRFNLPDERISASQEEHAAACERLGLQRCRITGLSYAIDADDNVRAALALKLDPAIARQFGKAATDLVDRNGGKLDSLEIGSSDEGEQIGNATQAESQLDSRIADLQAQLARAKPGEERASILQQIDSLKAEVDRQADAVAASQAALASTPMKFAYYGRGGAPGFHGNPIREAWHLFIATLIAIVGFVLRALAIMVPIAVAAALLIFLWRTRPVRAVRNWVANRVPDLTE